MPTISNNLPPALLPNLSNTPITTSSAQLRLPTPTTPNQPTPLLRLNAEQLTQIKTVLTEVKTQGSTPLTVLDYDPKQQLATVKINGQVLTLQTTVLLQANTNYLLQTGVSNGVFQLTSQPQLHALQTALLQSSIANTPLNQLINELVDGLKKLERQPNNPAYNTLMKIVGNLQQNLATPADLTQLNSLKQVIANATIFFEQLLLQNPLTLNNNLKGQLLQLYTVLSELKSVQTRSRQILSPEKLRELAKLALGDNTTLAELAQQFSDSDLDLETLFKNLGSQLNKLQFQQLQNVNHTMNKDQQLAVEIPINYQGHTDNLQLTVKRDSANKHLTHDPDAANWHITLVLNLKPLGTLKVIIDDSHQQINVHFYTDQENTYQLLPTHFDKLVQELRFAEVPIGKLTCQQTQFKSPPRSPPPPPAEGLFYAKV